jgi:all-trans-retinol 13,14-reductase
MDLKYDVLIAGSGLGGLLCAYMLGKEGLKVCILEKNPRPGGCLQTFRRRGVVFDTGVHYFGSLDPGQILHRYWNYFGLTRSLNLERMNPDGFDIIGIGDRDYPMAMGFDNFIDKLLPSFPGQKENLERYVQTLKMISGAFPLYNLNMPGDETEDLYQSLSAWEFYSKLSNGPLSAMLAGNNLLYAGRKENTPLHIPALVNHSFISSAWRPVDGSDQIALRLLEGIKDQGGELHTCKEIEEIGMVENAFRVRTATGECFIAKKFISNIHPAKTLTMMDPSSFRRTYFIRIRNMKNTFSSFAVYIVFKDNSFRYLDHNYYYHKTYEVWNGESDKNWPSGYMLHTPAPATSDGFAKSMIILAAMPSQMVSEWSHTTHADRGNEYNQFKNRCTGLLLNMAEERYPGLRAGIEWMEASTPLTWQDYTGTPDGSMYGIERDYKDPLSTILLPSTKIPGFYFTGQNINLHGVLGVTIGSVLTCGEILGLEYLLKKIKEAQ